MAKTAQTEPVTTPAAAPPRGPVNAEWRAPEPVGPWTAMRATPLVSALIIIVLLIAGVGVGAARKPKYTATARLAVLHLNFGAAGALSGFSTAAESLADAYARSVHADGIIQPLSAQFHISAQTLNNELTAAAVPQSPVFTVTATTRTAHTSVALAAAAAQQLVTYFHGVNSYDPDRPAIFKQLSSAQTTLAKDTVSKDTLLAGINEHLRSIHQSVMSGVEQAALAKAEGVIGTDQARVNALRTAYLQNLASDSSTQFVQPLANPSNATSDRKSKLVLFGFVGLVLGIGIAALLALVRQARRNAKHSAQLV